MKSFISAKTEKLPSHSGRQSVLWICGAGFRFLARLALKELEDFHHGNDQESQADVIDDGHLVPGQEAPDPGGLFCIPLSLPLLILSIAFP